MKQIVSRGHTRPLTEISFVEDGPNRTILVSSAHDKSPQIRNGETGDWVGTFLGHKGAVWSAKVDTLTRTLAGTASGDFTAKLWCATTGKELFEFKHKHVVKCIDFSTNTEKIATACQDGIMRIYNTCQPDLPPEEFRVAAAGMPLEGMTKLAWCDDPNLLIIGKRSGILEKWDCRVQSGAVSSTTVPGNDTVMDLEINTKHGLFMIASGKKVCSYAIDTLQLIKEFDMPNPMTFKEEGGVSLSPNGSQFIAGGSDLWLREFDYNSGEVLKVLKGHHGPIRCVRYHPSGLVGASGSEDGTIRLWELSNVTAT
eukprot:gene14855-19966_t